MLNHTEYRISTDGRKSYNISVPCFSGDGKDFYAAAKMNSFYSKVISEIYQYVVSLTEKNIRRAAYVCSYYVETDETENISVTLTLSLKILFNDSQRTKNERTCLTHTWNGGIILSKVKN